MPATAGRVRMPANNRVHSSAALQTHGIWQSAIGYDPYAPSKDDAKGASQSKAETEGEPENPYANFQGLLALARITGSNTDETRGACKKCGRVGHLTFQCRNFVSVKDDKNEKDLDAIEANVMAELGKMKGSVGKLNGKARAFTTEESSEEETESSDSSEDSEMEKIIAVRYGKKKSSGKSKSSKKKKNLSDDEDSESGRRPKRGRSKKRSGRKRSESVSDDDDAHRKKRNDRRRKRDESSDDEEHSSHRRKSRKEKRREEDGVIDTLMIQMILRNLLNVGRERAGELDALLILMLVSWMTQGLGDTQSGLTRRAGSAPMKMTSSLVLAEVLAHYSVCVQC